MTLTDLKTHSEELFENYLVHPDDRDIRLGRMFPELLRLALQLQSERDAFKEQACILQSQVDNHDVTLEQVRMAMKSNHAKEGGHAN